MTDLGKLGLGKRLSVLTKDTAIYGLGGTLNKAIALITFPVLARYFSVQEYGLIDLLNFSVVLVVTILVFGQDSAVARFFYEDTATEYRRQVVSQSFVFQGAILACVLPVLWICADQIAMVLSVGEQGGTIVKLMILQAPFFLFINFSQGLLKWTFKKWQFLCISVGSAVVTMLGLVAGILIFKLGVVHVFVVYLISRAIFGLLGVWFVREWLTIPGGWDRLKELLPFAMPFGVICVLNAALPVLERTLVKSLIGGNALGLYAAGAKIAMLIGLPVNAFQIAWGPFALSIFREEDAVRSYRFVLRVFTVLMFCVVLALTAMAEPVVRLLGSARYEGAGIVVFPLSMGLAVQAIGGITEMGIIFSKKSYLKLYGYGTMVLVAGVTIPLLSTRFGLVGAAWGSMAALLAQTVVEAWLAQRAHPIAWSYRGPVLIGVATLAFGMLHQATSGQLEVARVSLVPILGITVLLIASWLLLLSAGTRARLVTLLRQKWGRWPIVVLGTVRK
jgi:O-antigen/teichoic acid export membrane protein